MFRENCLLLALNASPNRVVPRPMHSIRSLSSVCPVTAARRRFNLALPTDVSVVIRRTHDGFV